MNKETEELKGRIETISEDGQCYKRTASDTASRILRACKEAGLVWYDGKRDKFKEIELE